MMSENKFCAESYFEGQADACEMFAKQFERYRQDAKNPEAEDFCAKIIKCLNSTREGMLIEKEKHKA